MDLQGTCYLEGEYLKQLLPNIGVSGASTLPIKFSLRMSPTADLGMPREPYGLYIELSNKLNISGMCYWDPVDCLPIATEELQINKSFLSEMLGTPLYARFSRGAKECDRR
jgi:hypothetical protein